MTLSESHAGPPPSFESVGVRLHPTWASPTRPDHSPCMPCPLARWIQTGALVGFFPVGAAFPVIQAGGHPRFQIRGLLRLHARYGLQGRSTTQSGLCEKASTRPVTRPSRLSATRLADYYLDGFSPTSDLRRWGALHKGGKANFLLVWPNIESAVWTRNDQSLLFPVRYPAFKSGNNFYSFSNKRLHFDVIYPNLFCGFHQSQFCLSEGYHTSYPRCPFRLLY